jgi:hypothetical protein
LTPVILILLSAPTLLLILPISEILFPIVSLFQLLADLAIAMVLQVRRSLGIQTRPRYSTTPSNAVCSSARDSLRTERPDSCYDKRYTQ